MNSLYTPAIREFIFSRNWPREKNGQSRVKFHITEKFEDQPHLYIVFFRDNWLTLTVEEQLQATSIVREIMAKLWNDGVPIYTGKMEAESVDA